MDEDIRVDFIDPTKICVENEPIDIFEARFLVLLLSQKFDFVDISTKDFSFKRRFDIAGYKNAIDNLFRSRAEWEAIPYSQNAWLLSIQADDGLIVLYIGSDNGPQQKNP